MNKLLKEIRACKICEAHLPLGCRPVLSAAPSSRIAIIGQAPGTRVHASGIPWDDKSGERLREWMGISSKEFYDKKQIAIVPMGFCYPGKGKSGDLQPRKECAAEWHERLFKGLKKVELTLLIGTYAQNYYLDETKHANLTKTVERFADYLPDYFVLPHPSPRNNIWLKKNPWFEKELVPILKQTIAQLIPK